MQSLYAKVRPLTSYVSARMVADLCGGGVDCPDRLDGEELVVVCEQIIRACIIQSAFSQCVSMHSSVLTLRDAVLRKGSTGCWNGFSVSLCLSGLVS